MRAAHIFLAAFIEDVAAVDGARTADGSVGHTVSDDKSLHPLPVVDTVGVGGSIATVVAGKVVVRDVGLVGIRVLNALQHGPFLQVQFHLVPQVKRAAQEGAGRNQHPSAALGGTGVQGSLDGGGAFFTGSGAIVADGKGFRGVASAGLDQEQQGEE